MCSVKEINWVYLAKIEVKYLSSEPELPVDIFGDLSGTFENSLHYQINTNVLFSGVILVRVIARNLSGLGETAEVLISLHGSYIYHF